MVERLTLQQKILKVELALSIIRLAKEKSISLAKASIEFKKDKRFVYDVNRRWIIKNPKGIPQEMVNEMKSVFNPKVLNYKLLATKKNNDN